MVKRKQKGGENYSDGGTGGSPGTLAADIIGLIKYSFATISDSMNVMNSISDLPGDMGTAFDEKAAPNPDNVQWN